MKFTLGRFAGSTLALLVASAGCVGWRWWRGGGIALAGGRRKEERKEEIGGCMGGTLRAP
jgi:hypothetical protein